MDRQAEKSSLGCRIWFTFLYYRGQLLIHYGIQIQSAHLVRISHTRVIHENYIQEGYKGDRGVKGDKGVKGYRGVKRDRGDTGDKGYRGVVSHTLLILIYTSVMVRRLETTLASARLG